jgi:hypothetical protein
MEITNQFAKKMYPDVPEWLKEKLEQEFGAEYLQPETYEEIKTFEDACEELGITNDSPIFEDDESPDEIAYKKLKIIIKAINQGWTPDWSDTNERKWWPYFNLSSGFGFSGTYYDYDYADTIVGSRLCFESEEKATYTATQFIDLYRAFLT